MLLGVVTLVYLYIYNLCMQIPPETMFRKLEPITFKFLFILYCTSWLFIKQLFVLGCIILFYGRAERREAVIKLVNKYKRCHPPLTCT